MASTKRLGSRTTIDDANRVATISAARPLTTTTITGTGTHGLVSDFHTVSGLSVGHVLQALTSTTFGFAVTPAPPAHDIVTAHSYTGGAALDVFGLSAANTIARLTPSSNPGAVAAILASTASGGLTLQTMTIVSSFGASGSYGFCGAAPSAQDTGWAVTAGYTADRAFNPEATTETEIARVLGTLIDVLKTKGLIGT